MAKLERRRVHVLAHLALAGALAGTLVGVAGCHWLAWPHDEGDFEFCDDAYDHCLEWAISAQEVQWCQEDVANCYDACEGTWEADADDDGETGDGNTSGNDGGDGGDSTDGGDTTDGGDSTDSETGSEEDICIELFGNCIDGAETLEDVAACEALYDQCENPGECQLPGCGGCPADELQACLDNFADCTELADTPEKVALCTDSFNTCTAPFADECAVDENPNLEPCLEQHALCVACAMDDAQVAACQDVFQTCMAG